MSRKIVFAVLVVALTAGLVIEFLADGPASEVAPVQAACSSLPSGGFDWTVRNVPFNTTMGGEPDTQLQWYAPAGTEYVGALVRAKYEDTEEDVKWYCAQITGLNAWGNCPGSAEDYPLFPLGVFGLTGIHNDPSQSLTIPLRALATQFVQICSATARLRSSMSFISTRQTDQAEPLLRRTTGRTTIPPCLLRTTEETAEGTISMNGSTMDPSTDILAPPSPVPVKTATLFCSKKGHSGGAVGLLRQA